MRKKLLLFHRDFQQNSGGHLKVWNYFNHVSTSQNYFPGIHFSATSVWDETNYWKDSLSYIEREWEPTRADALFLAGMDWNMLNHSARKVWERPVINLIQHTCHGNPDDPRFEFLSNRAIRICVSPEVQESIELTGRLNGPLFTIPNALALDEFPDQCIPWVDRKIDLLIVGIKQPGLANEIYSELEGCGLNILLLTEMVSRVDFLIAIGNSKTSLFLPNISEGFYLPALEAMALDTVVICPDCVGNRSFCFDQDNCFFVEYRINDLLGAFNKARNQSVFERDKMLQSAGATVKKHLMEGECKAFIDILDHAEQLW